MGTILASIGGWALRWLARAMVLVDRGTPGRDEDEAELAAMEDEEA